jgi:XTP/dITP diphosphohydrolase
MQLVLATHNAGKLAEFLPLLAPLGWDVTFAGALGLPEPDETGASFAENAKIKARAAAQASGLPALADDSGFCVAALDGGPGIFSARYAAGDYPAAFARIIAAAQAWRAKFVCALCFCQPDGMDQVFMGEAVGVVAPAPRGAHGFGYDAIFVPEGYHQTYAELGAGEKDRISHRALALRRFLAAQAQTSN